MASLPGLLRMRWPRSAASCGVAGLRRAAVLAIALASATLAPAADGSWSVSATTADELQAALLAGANERLVGGWRLASEDARMRTSRPWIGGVWHARLRGAAAGRPVMPLAVELEPQGRSDSASQLTVWLIAPLRREVLVLRDPVRRGEALGCEDTATAWRAADDVPADALVGECRLGDRSVALRPLGGGDLLRASDVGLLPAVSARAEVRVRVRVGQIVVERTGMALSNADRGDAVWVRLSASSQSVRGIAVDRDVVEVGGLQ